MRLVPVLIATVVAGVPAAFAVVKHAVPVTVAFWDGQRGLAAVTRFVSCGPRGSGELVTIERTADGGRTWTRVRDACSVGETLATAGSRTAFVAVPGGLLRTDDGGATWWSMRAPDIGALSFSSASIGWAVTTGTAHWVVQDTHDGGRTWRRLRRPCDGENARVALVGRSHGWILCLGQGGAGNEGKEVYETRDGGSSWHLRSRAPFGVKAVGRLDTYGYPTNVVFRPDGRGWMPQIRGATLTTRDGGKTWSQLSITQPEARFGLAVSFVSDASGFVLVQDEAQRLYRLVRTDDGGRTWRRVHVWPM